MYAEERRREARRDGCTEVQSSGEARRGRARQGRGNVRQGAARCGKVRQGAYR